jgi:hypothetical protein
MPSSKSILDTNHRVEIRDERRVGIDVERDQGSIDLVLELRPLGVADMDLLVLVDSDSRHLG